MWPGLREQSRPRANPSCALRETYSIVILASLSLVVAAFARSVSDAAVSYAVAAATSFLIAVLATIVREVRQVARAVFHIEVGTVTIVSIAAGFGMLGMVIAESRNETRSRAA